MTNQNKKLTTAQKVSSITAAVTLSVGSILAYEGGYVNNPDDPGGETNYGITKKVAVAKGYTGDMKKMPVEFAQGVYRTDYIDKPGYLPYMKMSLAIGHKLSDQGVNVGTTRATKWIQRALNSLNMDGQLYSQLKVDGVAGPASWKAYQKLIDKRGQQGACSIILKMLDAQQMMHYIELTENPKLKMKTFMYGWGDKRIGNIKDDECYAITE